MAKDGPPLVLSIQSEVVYGHVGNSAARPVLQAMGIETLCLPTVLLAHHPGHGAASGRATPAGELIALLDGLERLGVLGKVTAVLSGYLVDAAQVGVVIDAIARIRRLGGDPVFWCDPVLGDAPKGLYVAEAVAETVRMHLIPAADVVTPNLFEAAWLTGNKSGDAAELATALGPKSVVVTSVRKGDEIGALWWRDGAQHFAGGPMHPGVPGGLGDTFAAILLGLSLKGVAPDDALRHAVDALAALLSYERPDGWPAELPIITNRDVVQGLV